MGQLWNREGFHFPQTEVSYFLWQSKIHCWVNQFTILITTEDLSLNTWEQLHSRKDNREQRDSCLRQEHKETNSLKEHDHEWERSSDQWDNERELGFVQQLPQHREDPQHGFGQHHSHLQQPGTPSQDILGLRPLLIGEPQEGEEDAHSEEQNCGENVRFFRLSRGEITLCEVSQFHLFQNWVRSALLLRQVQKVEECARFTVFAIAVDLDDAKVRQVTDSVNRERNLDIGRGWKRANDSAHRLLFVLET